MTIPERIAQLDDEDKGELTEHLQAAIYHLASCWDALLAAEQVLGGGDIEIETEDISTIAGETMEPSEAYALNLGTILAHIEVAA
jgi:hypothetical protein